MACDRCDESRALGYKFCIKCGASFEETAVVPEHTVDNGGLLSDSTLNKTVVPSMLAMLASVIGAAITILIGFPSAFDTAADWTTNIVIFAPNILSFKFTGLIAQLDWIFIAAVLMASIAFFIYRSKEAFRINSDDYIGDTKNTPAFWMGLLFGSVLVMELIVTLLLGLVTPISTPEGLNNLTFEKALLDFSEAAVWEELEMRVLFFGLPMMVIALICKQKDFHKYLLGGFGASKIAIVFLIISTLIFSYAHLSGWGLWKIIPVALGGFMMGYLFMRFGLYASIIAHMVTDYMGVYTAVSEELVLVQGIIILLGMICIPILFKKTIKGIRKVKSLPNTGFGDQDSSDSNTD